jgi:DNA-binding GntR family transcriptional regulator
MAIIGAIHRQDAEKAEQAIRIHLRRSREKLAKEIEKGTRKNQWEPRGIEE